MGYPVCRKWHKIWNLLANYNSLELEGQSSEHNHLNLKETCMIQAKTMVELGGHRIMEIYFRLLITGWYAGYKVIRGWDKEF